MTRISEEDAFRQIFTDLKKNGKMIKSRDDGLSPKVIELENYTYTLPPYGRWCNFDARKINVDYVKHEFLWYLRGDAYDLEILDHAAMWKTLVNTSPPINTINSNYGQYIFGAAENRENRSTLFDYVINTLKKDPNSRRASMTILSRNHLLSRTNDYPCTYALNFRIRENQLKMSVHMRSQDAVFGMGNDAPCFSFIQEMVYAALLDEYPELLMGEYHHICDSLHVYEKHFEVMEKIADGSPYITVNCPQISCSAENDFLRTFIHTIYDKNGEFGWDFNIQGTSDLVTQHPMLKEMLHHKLQTSFNFSNWLTTFKPKETT